MKTFFIYPNEKVNDDCAFYLVDKDNPPEGKEGVAIYSHLCSHSGFAFDDLIGRRLERVKELNEKYGDFEVNQYGKIIGTFLKNKEN